MIEDFHEALSRRPDARALTKRLRDLSQQSGRIQRLVAATESETRVKTGCGPSSLMLSEMPPRPRPSQ